MQPHDYERGDATHPMHTDPLCRVCGQPRNAKVHQTFDAVTPGTCGTAPRPDHRIQDPAEAWYLAFTEYFDREGWTVTAQQQVMV